MPGTFSKKKKKQNQFFIIIIDMKWSGETEKSEPYYPTDGVNCLQPVQIRI